MILAPNNDDRYRKPFYTPLFCLQHWIQHGRCDDWSLFREFPNAYRLIDGVCILRGTLWAVQFDNNAWVEIEATSRAEAIRKATKAYPDGDFSIEVPRIGVVVKGAFAGRIVYCDWTSAIYAMHWTSRATDWLIRKWHDIFGYRFDPRHAIENPYPSATAFISPDTNMVPTDWLTQCNNQNVECGHPEMLTPAVSLEHQDEHAAELPERFDGLS